MEYPWRAPQREASWYSPNFLIQDGAIPVPAGPGMGLEIDPAYVAQLESVAKIT